MYNFDNDYSDVAHPEVISLLQRNLLQQNIGYGLDIHSEEAKKLITKHLSVDVDIHFLVGGTSANKIVIDHFLRPFHAIIAVESGHINVNETGAIEANGRKILTTTGINGKITPEEITTIVKNNQNEHTVVPKMVYISNSTEVGTIYTKQELTNINQICKELDLFLFVDGARLGAALTAKDNDLTLNDIAELTDVFYIGGTKNGAMFGEAVVIKNPYFKQNFRHSIKRNGGLLAKGFITGMQFKALFTNDLFFKLAKQANQAAQMLINELIKLNIKFSYPPQTNLLFIKLNNKVIATLQDKYLFEVWIPNNNESIIRLVTSWSTNPNQCKQFIEDLSSLL